MSLTLHIPAKSREVALKVAYAVEAGRIPCLGQYLEADRASRAATALSELHREPHEVFCVVIEHRTHDDGRIPVARIVDRVSDIAAALMIVIGGCFAVGWSTLL